MKHATILVVALASSLASAQDLRGAEIANMFADCSCKMDLGTCAGFAEASARMSNVEYLAPRILGSLGVVPSGFWYDWNSNPAMCDALVRDCRLDWSGDGCRIARSQFRQTEHNCRGTRTEDAPQAQDTRFPLAASLLSFLALAAIRRRRPRFIKQ